MRVLYSQIILAPFAVILFLSGTVLADPRHHSFSSVIGYNPDALFYDQGTHASSGLTLVASDVLKFHFNYQVLTHKSQSNNAVGAGLEIGNKKSTRFDLKYESTKSASYLPKEFYRASLFTRLVGSHLAGIYTAERKEFVFSDYYNMSVSIAKGKYRKWLSAGLQLDYYTDETPLLKAYFSLSRNEPNDRRHYSLDFTVGNHYPVKNNRVLAQDSGIVLNFNADWPKQPFGKHVSMLYGVRASLLKEEFNTGIQAGLKWLF